MIGVLLNITGSILLWVLYPLVNTYTFIYLIIIKRDWNAYDNYRLQLAKAKDQFGNVFIQHPANHLLIKSDGYKFGNEDEKISSVVGKNKQLVKLILLGIILDKILNRLDKDHSINSIDNTINQRNMKVDEGSKRNLIFIAKWALGWGVWAFIDIYFNISMFETVIETPVFYCGILGIAFTLLMAMFEARYFHYKNSLPIIDSYNEHYLLTFIRISFLATVFYLTNWMSVLCYLAAFPFFHDGMYYYRRNKLNRFVYPKKWFDQSTTSTALLTKIFTPVVRTILAALAIAGLILIHIYHDRPH